MMNQTYGKRPSFVHFVRRMWVVAILVTAIGREWDLFAALMVSVGLYAFIVCASPHDWHEIRASWKTTGGGK